MAQLKLPEKVTSFVKKYRYVLLVLAIGMLLMLLPERKQTNDVPSQQIESAPTESMQEQLASILSKVDGAGKVEVLLAVSEGEKILYQTDEEISSSAMSRIDTVILTNDSRAQEGMICQIIPEKYEGAVIVCEGGSNPNVKLAIVDAVTKLTGLGADKITVLKMK